jgi:hypothetical protein
MLLQTAVSIWMSGGFDPRSGLFGLGEQGIWYDLNDDSTIFQDSAGTTLASLGDPVGLTLDKSRWDGRGVVNRLIHTNDVTQAAWSSSSHITRPSANVIVETVVADAHALAQTAPFTIGLTYTQSVSLQKGTLATAPDVMQLTFGSAAFGTSQFATVNVVTGAVINVAGGAICTALGADPDYAGAWRFSYTATATATATTSALGVVFCQNNPTNTRVPSYAGSTTADCRVYKCQAEIGSSATAYQANGASVGGPGNHAIQSTSGSRPIRGRMPKRGRVNLYVNSESLAGYSNSGLVTSSTLSGFTSALQFGYDGATLSLSYGNATPVSSTSYTLSAFVQMDDNGAPSFLSATASSSLNDFSLVLGNVAINPTTYTVSLVSGSLYRVSVSVTTATVTNTNTGVLKFATNSSRTFKVTGRQLELGSTATAYQHVIDSLGFNITESGQPSCGYLSFNGSNQWMQTAAAVNFSATDEMSVFVGGRVSAEVATQSQHMIEHTANAGATNGAFEFSPMPSNGTIKLGDNRYRSRGTDIAVATNTGLTASPRFFVCTGLSDISADTCLLRQNGVQVATSATDQGTGNYANAVTYFGARAGSSLFFNGLMFSTIIRGSLTSGALLTRTEQYVARQTPTVNL